MSHCLFVLASVSLTSAEESHIKDLSLELCTALSGAASSEVALFLSSELRLAANSEGSVRLGSRLWAVSHAALHCLHAVA